MFLLSQGVYGDENGKSEKELHDLNLRQEEEAPGEGCSGEVGGGEKSDVA